MSYTFRIKGLETGDKCDWCRKFIGDDGIKWSWTLDQNANPTWPFTDVIIRIEDPAQASHFKLSWADDVRVISE